MKVFKWMGTLAVAVSLLTSCLGESDNRFTRQGFAVAGVSEKSYKTVLYTSYGPMYSANLMSQVVDGACYTVQYEVDLNAPENKAQTMDYYTATITVFDEVSKGNTVFYNVPDTTTMMAEEQVVTNVAGFTGEVGGYLNGYLFLNATLNELKEQKNNFTLYWDRSKEAEENSEGIPTYTLFLRVVKIADGTGSAATSTNEIRAYRLNEVIDAVNTTEAEKGSDRFNLRINYIKEASEEGKPSWDKYDYQFAVYKES